MPLGMPENEGRYSWERGWIAPDGRLALVSDAWLPEQDSLLIGQEVTLPLPLLFAAVYPDLRKRADGHRTNRGASGDQRTVKRTQASREHPWVIP